MKLIIESTPELAMVGNAATRMWNGTTESGSKVLVFVALIAQETGEPDDPEMEAELVRLGYIRKQVDAEDGQL